MFQSLAISPATLQILEGCLGGRSAENREISREPDLFGWSKDKTINDDEFDPPELPTLNVLLAEIVKAQTIFKHNQLAVSMNRPRQLIPFRLKDFATGPNGEPEGDDHAQ